MNEKRFCACGCGKQVIGWNYHTKQPIRFVLYHNIGNRDTHLRWKSGRIKSHGYFLIYKPDHPYHDDKNYVLEHRLIMEKKLGRYLRPDEDVHHINGDKEDNRIENLELLSHVEHGRLSAKYGWKLRKI